MDTILINKLKTAILRGEDTYNGISLPKVQTSGTGMQISGHATQLATNLYKGLVSDLNIAKVKLKQAKETCISSYIDEASRELDKSHEQLNQ